LFKWFATPVGLATEVHLSYKQLTLETNSKRGTIDLGVVVRRSRFETTALEMPAGFGLIHHRANLHAMGGRARTYGQAM
jgi:hypothetical protein